MLAGGGDLVVVTSPNLKASTEDLQHNSDFITAILTVSPAANPPASFLAEISAEMDTRGLGTRGVDKFSGPEAQNLKS